jgi:citrate synthase
MCTTRNVRMTQIVRLIGKMPTLAAYAYRHRLGLPYIYPDPELCYTKNYMNMLWKKTEPKYAPTRCWRAPWKCCSSCMPTTSRTAPPAPCAPWAAPIADPYATTAAAIAALWGPLHGGANEEVLRMLDEIGSKDQHPGLHRACQSRETRQADGLRAPRLQELRPARAHHQAGGRGSLRGDRAQSQDRHRPGTGAHRARRRFTSSSASSIPTWISTPGIIYQAMGFTPDQFTVLFGIPRTVGWLASGRR